MEVNWTSASCRSIWLYSRSSLDSAIWPSSSVLTLMAGLKALLTPVAVDDVTAVDWAHAAAAASQRTNEGRRETGA